MGGDEPSSDDAASTLPSAVYFRCHAPASVSDTVLQACGRFVRDPSEPRMVYRQDNGWFLLYMHPGDRMLYVVGTAFGRRNCLAREGGGVIASKVPPAPDAGPHATAAWQCWTGAAHAVCSAMECTTKSDFATDLFVTIPADCGDTVLCVGGRYRITDTWSGGVPVWEQVCGGGTGCVIYAHPRDGKYYIVESRYAQENMLSGEGGGVVAALQGHGGSGPNEQSGWQAWVGEDHVQQDQLRVEVLAPDALPPHMPKTVYGRLCNPLCTDTALTAGGRFDLTHEEAGAGMPVYAGHAGVLYVHPRDAKWYFVGGDVWRKNVREAVGGGHLASAEGHGGNGPEKQVGVWTMWNGTEHVALKGVSFSSRLSLPFAVTLKVSDSVKDERVRAKAGTYSMTQEPCCGLPVWRNGDAGSALCSFDSDCRYHFFGGEGDKDGSDICAAEMNGGRGPHEMRAYSAAGKEYSSDDLQVTEEEQPQQRTFCVTVKAECRDALALGGWYNLDAEVASGGGLATWRQAGGEGVLYLHPADFHFYFVGRVHFESNMRTETGGGMLSSESRAINRCPTQVPQWRIWDQELRSSVLRPGAVHLRSRSPAEVYRMHLDGGPSAFVLRREKDAWEWGMPVYAGEECRLACRNGTWTLERCGDVLLASQAYHGGSMPEEVEVWQGPDGSVASGWRAHPDS